MTIQSDKIAVGVNAVAARNFVLKAPNTGELVVSTGNPGAETDILSLTANGMSFGGVGVPMIGGIGRNFVINGEMEFAVRGASFTNVADDQYTLDRWKFARAGAAFHTITQDTDVPTVAQAGRLFTHSLKMALTTPDTSIASGDYVALRQRVEGYNWRHLAQRPFTLSFWWKSPITGIHSVGIRNGGSVDHTVVKEFTVNAANTWEKKVLTFPASPSSGAGWNYTNGVGIDIFWVLAAGSGSATSTLDSWQASTAFASTNQVNGVNTGITPYLITGVQLEVGSNATDFESRHYTTEFALCERYYQRGLTSYNMTSNGYASLMFRVPMRTTPTATWISIWLASAEAGTVFTPYNSNGMYFANGSGLYAGGQFTLDAEL